MLFCKYKLLPVLVLLSAGPASAQSIGLCGVGGTNISGEATIENTLTLSGNQNLEEAEGAFTVDGTIDCGLVCGGGGTARRRGPAAFGRTP